MSLTALSLVLLAAILHATWNLVAKKSGGATVFAFGTAVVTVGIWTPIALGLCFALPAASPVNWDAIAWSVVFFSALIHTVYYIVLLYGYTVAPLSVVYPVARGSGPLLSFFSALFIFSETLTLFSFVGVSLITLGILLLSWQRGTSLHDSSALQGIKWGLITGATISVYTLSDAYAVKTLGLNPLLFDYCSNAIRALILFPFVMFKREEIISVFKQNIRSMLIIGTLGPTAYMLVLTAVQIAPVSHVAPAREVSMLFAAFFGGKILKEGNLLQRMLAAGLIGLGVIALVV